MRDDADSALDDSSEIVVHIVDVPVSRLGASVGM